MTLSFNKLNEIAELYESIAASEQEVLNEIGVNFGGQRAVDKVRASAAADFAAQKKSSSQLDAARSQRFGGTSPVVKAAKGGVQGTLDKTSGKWTASTPAKPAAPAPTPTRTPAPAPTPKATTPAKPATPAPTSTSAKTSPTAAPARNGFGASTSSMDAKSSVSSATEPASAPAKRPSLAAQNAELRAMQASSRQRQGLTQSFDLFDVVLGHLIDEGYADTEEAATAIMANMSEDWRESIVEEVFGEDKKYDANRKRAAQRAAARNAARDAGKTGAVPGVGYVTPRRESETYRDSAGVERHKSGAKNA